MPFRSVIFFLFLLVWMTATDSVAAQDSMQPAGFAVEDSDKILSNRIIFPQIKGDMSAMIKCFSMVEKSGKMKNFGCFTKDQFDAPFATAVTKAAQKARMTPATINGRKQSVYIQFRAEFISEDDDRSIYLYLNPGESENIEAYGYAHIAGQRVIDNNDWRNICPKSASYIVLVKAFLGENGKSDNPSITHLAGVLPTESCQQAIRQTILTSRYTPAMVDGLPVPSTYVEMFGN